MRRKRWVVPRRPDIARTDVEPKVFQKSVPKFETYLLAMDDHRRWQQASEIVRSTLAVDLRPNMTDLTAIGRVEQRLQAIEDENRRRSKAIERKHAAATNEMRRVLGFDYEKVQQALQSTSANTSDVVGCGVSFEEWTVPANKSWHLNGSSLVTVRPNGDNSHFDVVLQGVGTGIQNHYYLPIFPEEEDFQWSCLAIGATVRITGLADTSSGGSVFIRVTQTMLHYRDQPWNVGSPGSWFRPPDEGSPIHRRYCNSGEQTDGRTGSHILPAFENYAYFVSHDVRAGDFFEYIQWVNVIAYSSTADLTGVGGVTMGKPYARLYGS